MRLASWSPARCFLITFAVNFVARYIVNRRAEFSGAN